MNDIEQMAWETLCFMMKDDLHQYDYWKDVPKPTQDYYVNLVQRMNQGAELGGI